MKSPQPNRLGSVYVAAFAFAFAALALLASSPTVQADEDSSPNLPSPLCDSLPAGNSVIFHVYAVGVQIYQWNGTTWVFVAPSATLYADPGHHGKVGIHYAGP